MLAIFVAPGIGRTCAPLASSHASATTYGVVACLAAMRASVASSATRVWRQWPPTGE